MENLIDCYTVMKVTGEMIDAMGYQPANYQNWNLSSQVQEIPEVVTYWNLNNLWWSAASIYVPEMKRLNNLSGPSN